MDRPFFSIVLPCKNSVRTIERTINSVVNQKCAWELIIVDGASSDGTLDVVKRYMPDARIILDSRKDNGIYAAINRGIKLANGFYVGVLNADDA